MNKRQIGTKAEELAAQYLTRNGMRIVERNFRCRQGEIDLIGYHEGYLVFAEVKYRSTADMGSPEAAVGNTKQMKICRVADYYRMLYHIGMSTPVRYDVIAIQGETYHWYRNAFPHRYIKG